MTRDEFIEAHWEESLVIDAKMREAAGACVKNFLGEDQVVDSLLSKEKWMVYDQSSAYFLYLTYCYSLKCLGDRILKLRQMVEFLFREVILECSLGEGAVIVTTRDDSTKRNLSETLRKQKESGPARLEIGKEWMKVYFETFKKLPGTQPDLDKARPRILRSLVLKLFKRPFRKKRTESEKLEALEKEAETIQVQVAELAKRWQISPLPEIDYEGWIFENLESANKTQPPQNQAES